MLVNCFNNISLPRKSWVGISDCPATIQLEDACRMARNLCVALGVHQDNMSVCFITPYTPLYIVKLGFTGEYIIFLFLL